MQINNKYQTGDRVNFFRNLKPSTGIIERVRGTEWRFGVITIEYYIAPYGWIEEAYLHRSKQELLQSLA